MGRLRGRRHCDEKGHSCDAEGRDVRGCGYCFARPNQSREGSKGTWYTESVRFVRRTSGGSGNRSDLQSSAESFARTVDDQSGGGRQTCAVRKTGRSDRERSDVADRSSGSNRGENSGSVHGADTSTVAWRLGTDSFRQDWKGQI